METKSAYTAFRHEAGATWSSARRGLPRGEQTEYRRWRPAGIQRRTRHPAAEERVRPRRNAATGSIVVPQMRRASLPMRGRARHDRARRSAT
jgi:hypothetical protein